MPQLPLNIPVHASIVAKAKGRVCLPFQYRVFPDDLFEASLPGDGPRLIKSRCDSGIVEQKGGPFSVSEEGSPLLYFFTCRWDLCWIEKNMRQLSNSTEQYGH